MVDLIDRIIEREGGYTEDQGGPTNFGITIPSLGDFRKKRVTKEDIEELDIKEAREFYLWWFKRYGLDLIENSNLQELLFDCMVNHGPDRAIRWLQTIAKVTVDGKLGKGTSSAVNSNSTAIYYELVGHRIKFYVELAINNWSKNGPSLKGWINRGTKFIKEI